MVYQCTPPSRRCGHDRSTLWNALADRAGLSRIGPIPQRGDPHAGLSQSRPRIALDLNNEGSLALIEALKQAGIAEEDIQTTNLQVWSDFNSRGERTRTEVNNSITVKVRDLERLGEILAAGLATGDHVFVDWMEFGLENPGPVKQELREKAVEDARLRAERLAAGAGAELGALLLVREVEFQPHFGGPQPTAGTVEGPASVEVGVPIELGPLEVGVFVEVVFELN